VLSCSLPASGLLQVQHTSVCGLHQRLLGHTAVRSGVTQVLPPTDGAQLPAEPPGTRAVGSRIPLPQHCSTRTGLPAILLVLFGIWAAVGTQPDCCPPICSSSYSHRGCKHIHRPHREPLPQICHNCDFFHLLIILFLSSSLHLFIFSFSSPLQVANIVGRSEMLAAVFFLLALITYQKATQNRNSFTTLWVLATISLSVTSLLCKEQGVTVLGLCLVSDLLPVVDTTGQSSEARGIPHRHKQTSKQTNTRYLTTKEQYCSYNEF